MSSWAPSTGKDSAFPYARRCLTTRWSRPGQPGVGFGAILALAGRAAHLGAVRWRSSSVHDALNEGE